MKLQSFRIQNYKSVKDTGWCKLSIDNISAIVGQNESGKSTILQALYSFYTRTVDEENLRNDNSLPVVTCSFKFSKEEFTNIFNTVSLPKRLFETISSNNMRLNIQMKWDDDGNASLDFDEQNIKDIFELSWEKLAAILNTNAEGTTVEKPPLTIQETSGEFSQIISKDDFIELFMQRIPNFILFQNGTSLLPDKIDVDAILDEDSKVEGYQGVMNFLSISGINIEYLMKVSSGKRNRHMDDCNKKITTNFQEFWSQKIGKGDRITIEVRLERHDNSVAEKAGDSYLEFWVCDNSDRLHPKQRSEGVRWFMSFYLQLKANAINIPADGSIFLIDEPGGSLHARAQEDVLKVFEDIENKIQVIFTTHSPYMVKMETLYRVLAAERSDEDDNSETKIVEAYHLGSASTNTLAPILDRMGVNFSNQNVIQKKNNVLLEEISAFYYLTAFKKLTGSTMEAYFIPCTGVTNIPHLVYMFIGWGLDFVVVVDDDNSGRKVYNDLKETICQNDDDLAKKKLYKIKGGIGIEDLFTKTDFKKFILDDDAAAVGDNNSEYMKINSFSKPVYAAKFMLKVEDGTISIDKLNKQTQENIKKIILDI